MDRKILVTGAKGQLGSELQDLTTGDRRFIFTDVTDEGFIKALDICDAKAVTDFVKANDIGTIINCAAYTNVNAAESNETLCNKINVEGAKNLAKAAKLNDAALVQISTDYVFSGVRKRGSYKEDDHCSPQSVYGRGKRRCEIAIRRIGCRGIIIRTAWLYSSYGNNFVKTMLSLGRSKSEIGVVADQIGSPTYARDLAKAILEIIPQIGDFKGEIFHYTNEGQCSWFEFAAAIMAYAGLDCKVNPLTTAQYPTPAERPAYSVLSKSKIRDTFGVNTPWWSASLKECLEILLK